MDFIYPENLAILDPTAGFSDFSDNGDIIGGPNRRSSDDESTNSGSRANTERNSEFWETQHQLLHDALHRTRSVEKQILSDTEAVVTEIRLAGLACQCSDRPVERHCRKCVMRGVAERLREVGYDSAICNSKWRRSAEIFSGEHSYIDVVVETKQGTVRFVIELSFRAEFEMARASPDYNSLVSHLPEVFVGKSEKLQAVIMVMCDAAKMCTKENKMHLAPWRKHKYMLSKWLGTCQRMPAGSPPLPEAITGIMDRQPRQRASMLTFDLHRNTSVKVL